MEIIECKCGFKTKSKISYRTHIEKCNSELISLVRKMHDDFLDIMYDMIFNIEGYWVIKQDNKEQPLLELCNQLKENCANSYLIAIENCRKWIIEAYKTTTVKYIKNAIDSIKPIIDVIN